MTTWIFVCNREGWYHDVDDEIERAKQTIRLGSPHQKTWSCGSTKKIQVGDQAFFYHSGLEPRGFFARGTIIPANENRQLRLVSAVDSHVSSAYDTLYGDLRVAYEWDSVTNYDYPLKVDDLRKQQDFRGANFLFRDSGMSFREQYVDLLNERWEEHVSKQISLGYAESVASLKSSVSVSDNDLHAAQHKLAKDGSFDPKSLEISRKRVARSIVERRGQPQFRAKLLEAYSNCCAITKFDACEALEAAHIIPFSQNGTHEISNGLLLRADLHTLFDLNLIAIEPETLTVHLAPSLRKTSYGSLHGERLKNPPLANNHQPDQQGLQQRWQQRQWEESE